MKKAIDDPDLDVTADHVLILRNAGPQGGPGMPEWGMLPIPTKLVKQGVRDMVRLSDARMSGTSYGACILHVAPESYIGGPLALVRTATASRSTSPRAPSTSMCRRRSWQNAAPHGSSRSRASSAAMAGCSPGTSSRPMKAAISISSKPALARRSASRRFIEANRRSGATRSIEPGTSRFRVWSFGPSRNDELWDGNHDQTQRRDPRQTQNRLHRHGRHRACSSAAFASR